MWFIDRQLPLEPRSSGLAVAPYQEINPMKVTHPSGRWIMLISFGSVWHKPKWSAEMGDGAKANRCSGRQWKSGEGRPHAFQLRFFDFRLTSVALVIAVINKLRKKAPQRRL